MKARLMDRDRDFAVEQPLPWNEAALTRDLELGALWQAMAGDDEFVFDVARKAILGAPKNGIETILYRQEVLKDCLGGAATIRQLYRLMVEAIDRARRSWWNISTRSASSMLYGSLDQLTMCLEVLRRLRDIVDEHAGRFESEGFSALFARLRGELSDGYLATIQDHLAELRFRKGILLGAELGQGNEGANYTLRHPGQKQPGWLQRVLGKGPPAYTFYIAERDQAGAEIVASMRQRGISRVAIALAGSAEHVLSFFANLRAELAFYVGCLNLHDRLSSKPEPVCFPTPTRPGGRAHAFKGLYDACLTLHVERRLVGNEANADGRSFVIVTGANQGGKSTFLRSVGVAQLMMQAGMFVGAEVFRGELCSALFTHYKREEDPTMKSGKLDEELARMSEIVDHIGPNSMLLFNESFAATNEREGSEIARQIVRALLESGARVFFVTHLYEFAHGFVGRQGKDVLFLRAERLADGTRPFRLVEAAPLETSYGEDLYREVFGVEPGGTDRPIAETAEARERIGSAGDEQLDRRWIDSR